MNACSKCRSTETDDLCACESCGLVICGECMTFDVDHGAFCSPACLEKAKEEARKEAEDDGYYYEVEQYRSLVWFRNVSGRIL